jgi:DNA-binding transcriptional MerR regulator
VFNHLAGVPVYNTRAVVQRTGVPADTFRAWERRYGIPKPERTAGNQRLYSERDVSVISWLRDQTRRGLTISQAVALYKTEAGAKLPVQRQPLGQSSRAIPANGGPAELFRQARAAMISALSAFDAAGAERALEETIAIASVEQVCTRVLEPVLVEIGDRWERGELSVSVEHFATAFVLRKIGALFNVSGPDVGRGPIVAACVEGELHEVALLLTSLLLSRRGYRIIYLGPNLPTRDLVQAIQVIRPPVVLLSTSTLAGADRMTAAVDRIRSEVAGAQDETAPESLLPIIGFGGRIFETHPERQERIAGIYLGTDIDAALLQIDALMANTARTGVA